MNRETIKGDVGASTTEYAHLVGASCGKHAVATCLHFDGLRADLEMGRLLDLAEQWFTQHGFRPRVLLVGDPAAPRLRPTIKTLRESDSGRKAIEVMKRLEIFPKGRATVEDNWLPSAYFAVSMKRPTAVFMSVNTELESSAALAVLKHGDSVLGACASYAFWFPVRYSPLAYFWQLSFQPNGRDDGRWGDRERSRITNWRDNILVGIGGGIDQGNYSAREAYVRDAYPLMLLGAAHMARSVGPLSLRRAVETRRLGSISPVGEKFAWSIPTEKLAEAQALLDDYDISLSGRFFDQPER